MKFLKSFISLEALGITVKRFPVSVFCSIILALCGVLGVHDVDIFGGDDNFSRLCVFLLFGFFNFGMFVLVAERYDWPSFRKYTAPLALQLLFTLLILLSEEWHIPVLFIFPSIVLFLMVSPYITRGSNNSFWRFNYALGISFTISFLASMILISGVCAGIFAIEKLFGVDFPDEIYFDLWIFASCVMAPIYALSRVPTVYDQDAQLEDNLGISFIANWITVPLVFGYLAILYAYLINILVTGNVPNGLLVYFVTGFVGSGISTYLIAYPLRKSGSVQLRFFYKVFFYALVIPICFHLYAVWERISAYGVTEQRYMIALCAVWFVIITAINLFKAQSIKIIPLSLAVLLLVASYGPWSATNVSVLSQSKRLETALVNADILQDGKIIPLENLKALSFEMRGNISSIIDYLCRGKRYGALHQWFEKSEDNKSYGGLALCQNRQNFESVLGFKHVSKYEIRQGNNAGETFVYRYTEHDYIDTKNFDGVFAGKHIWHYSSDLEKKIERADTHKLDGSKVVVAFNGAEVILRTGEEELLREDLVSIVVPQHKQGKERLSFSAQNEKYAFKIDFIEIRGNMKDNITTISNINYNLLFKRK